MQKANRMPSGDVLHLRKSRAQNGFTYLWLIFVLAINAAGIAVVGELWTVQSQRNKEIELAFRAQAIIGALESYRAASRANDYCAPKQIEELLEDLRTFPTRRHLRMPYRDPFSPTGDWEWIKDSQERLLGVISHPPETLLITAKARGSADDTGPPGRYQVGPATTKIGCLMPPPPAIKQLDISRS